jgi:hypothetical protein
VLALASDVRIRSEHRPLRLHLGEAAVDVALLHLELGDPVAQEPADPVGPLVDGDLVTGPGELLGRGQAGGTGADHGHPLAGFHRGDHRRDPALVEGPVDDRDLDLLDGDGVGVDAEHAGALAGGRAQPAGELGEVVGGMQPVDGVVPQVPVHEVVPVRDEVAERAALVAERDAAVHAPAGLGLELALGEGLVDLVPVEEAHRHRPPRRQLARVLQEAFDVAHAGYPCAAAMMASSMSRPCSSARAMASSTRL